MATAVPVCRTARQAKRAGPDLGIRAEGVSRAERGNDGSPSGARRRRRLDAKHDSATGHAFWPGTPMQSWRCNVDFLRWTSSLCGIGIAAPAQPGRRSRGGGVAGAPSEARRGCAACTSPGVQAPARSAAGAKSLAPGRSRKKGAPPRRAAHRMAPSAISLPSSSATAQSRRVRRRRTADRPRSAR